MKRPSSSTSLLLFGVLCFMVSPTLVHLAYSFKPHDFILVNCGSPIDATDDDKRLWTNDSNAHFLSSFPSSSFLAEAANTDLSLLPTQVPLNTARVFTSAASTLSFTGLSKGRHFLRLYFYPAFYHGLDSKNAFFSVKTGPYTLLSNFSPAIVAASQNQFYIIQEFFITITSSGKLTLTFTPAASATNCFAFINGIEVVSSPELFCFGIRNSSIIVFNGMTFPIYDYDVLQTVVRLNVGGNYISPMEDSGLFRSWFDDSNHILGTGFGVSYPADESISIRYSYSAPDYIAPRDVYATARSMGPNAYVNMNYNLTWWIAVDNGFWYLVRLHFCEIQSEVYKENQRVFKVYINDLIADPGVDVIFYAKEKVQDPTYTGVPVYRDYMLLVLGQSDKQTGLLVGIHPNLESNSYYADAILNGLEVFKVNQSSGNLAGPNPSLTAPPPSEIESLHLRGKRGGAHGHEILGAEVGLAAMLVLGVCLFFLMLLKQRWSGKEREREEDGALCRKRSNYGLLPKKGMSAASSTTIGCIMKGEESTDCVPITSC